MYRTLSILLSLGLGACVSTPAPGTRPTDMTVAGHEQACRSHEQRAQALETAERFNTNEGYSDNESTREYDVAKQHERAAKALDPHAPDCL